MVKPKISFLILLMAAMMFSSCSIFKKKCDCPPVGNSQRESPTKPMVMQVEFKSN